MFMAELLQSTKIKNIKKLKLLKNNKIQKTSYQGKISDSVEVLKLLKL